MDIFIAFLGAGVLLAVVICALPVIYDYRIANKRIEVVLFGIVSVYGIRVDDIESISVGDWRDLGLATVHFGNRFRSSGIVIIEKRSGIFHRVAMTPRNPVQFIASVGDAADVARNE